MKKLFVFSLVFGSVILFTAFINSRETNRNYTSLYQQRMDAFVNAAVQLHSTIAQADTNNTQTIVLINESISRARNCMKAADFWFRYLDPLAQKSINGPLPVEWETEVFEKFEKPYRRTGAGLAIAAGYLGEPGWEKDSLAKLVQASVIAINTFRADSITRFLDSYHHFYLCNRLYLLNLASIYTTGFDCPDTTQVIPELKNMLTATREIYTSFNQSFPQTKLPSGYLQLYDEAIAFVNTQKNDYSNFDHFHFIKDYVNPLFKINQKLINGYNVISRSFVDYTINDTATSIFSKQLYRGQNTRGVFLRIEDKETLKLIDSFGKLLFYDPILSANNQRSCASCHKPTEYFTDTTRATPLQFNNERDLSRNSISLINAQYNHLAMMDGRHISLQDQAKDVITNPLEMASDEGELMQKILSCPDYKKILKKLMAYIPEQESISIAQVASALTTYYCKFGNADAAFDDAMNKHGELTSDAEKGFNLFMSKAQCGTCHFMPQFNGVKPPYIGSEFEVLGVPADTAYKALGNDVGRYMVNQSGETLHAFRTGSLRNITHTAPYMHNGIFTNLDQVIEFYNGGGGSGKGLLVPNQTLSSEKLNLTVDEKKQLVAFLQSLDEKVLFEAPPKKLPVSTTGALNKRKVGGIY
ncbi:MAG: cytochrome c peroxidase [Ferruginibacter sp.]